MNVSPDYIAMVTAVFAHAGASIWWASKITTTMTFQKESLDRIATAISNFEATRYTKEDAARDFSVRDQQINAIFKKMEVKHVK